MVILQDVDGAAGAVVASGPHFTSWKQLHEISAASQAESVSRGGQGLMCNVLGYGDTAAVDIWSYLMEDEKIDKGLVVWAMRVSFPPKLDRQTIEID